MLDPWLCAWLRAQWARHPSHGWACALGPLWLHPHAQDLSWHLRCSGGGRVSVPWLACALGPLLSSLEGFPLSFFSSSFLPLLFFCFFFFFFKSFREVKADIAGAGGVL